MKRGLLIALTVFVVAVGCTKRESKFVPPSAEPAVAEQGSAGAGTAEGGEPISADGAGSNAGSNEQVGMGDSAAAAEFLRQKAEAEARARPPVPAPDKETVATADAEKIAGRAKDALNELADAINASNGDCKKMAVVVTEFSNSKQDLFREMQALEPKLTVPQRKAIEEKFRTDVTAIGARLTKPLAGCTQDPDLIKAMTQVAKNGGFSGASSTAGQPAPPAAPTVSDPVVRAALISAMDEWATATDSLATGITSAAGDCAKVATQLKAFTDISPALVAKLTPLLRQAAQSDLEELKSKYAPKMDKMEATVTPAIKACEKDPAVAELMQKLPHAK
jgi:hypothetical protein